MNTTEFGKVLKRRRDELGISRFALAKESGVAENAILRIEKGRTQHPLGRTIYALCRAVDINPDEYLEDAR